MTDSTKLPTFPSIGCPHERTGDPGCGLERRGIGYTCVEGRACGRHIDDRNLVKALDQYDRAMLELDSKSDACTSRFVFACVRVLEHGATPWGYRAEPGEFEGPYDGESVEALLDDLAFDVGEPSLASSRVQWWVRGDALWIAPLEAR